MDIAENQALHAVLYAVIGDTGALSIYMLGGRKVHVRREAPAKERRRDATVFARNHLVRGLHGERRTARSGRLRVININWSVWGRSQANPDFFGVVGVCQHVRR